MDEDVQVTGFLVTHLFILVTEDMKLNTEQEDKEESHPLCYQSL